MKIDSTQKAAYPALDRASFLMERAFVPRYIPRYSPEDAQLFALIAAACQQHTIRLTNEVEQIEY